jgi:HEPN domain-containing protein
MNYIENAADWERSAYNSEKSADYRVSVFSACMAAECYLKAQLLTVQPDSEYEKSHDVLTIYRILSSRYKPSKDLSHDVILCRKYYTESRYPQNRSFYTESIAKDFLRYMEAIKNYVENECHTSFGDLEKKYKK